MRAEIVEMNQVSRVLEHGAGALVGLQSSAQDGGVEKEVTRTVRPGPMREVPSLAANDHELVQSKYLLELGPVKSCNDHFKTCKRTTK